MGNALITSGKGGLKETSFNQIILKKNNSLTIQKEIEKLIKNPKGLKKIQINNYKLNFTNNNNNNRILHIASFDEKNDFRLSNINLATKISNGFIKNKSQITNFSDRFFSQTNAFSNIDDKIINIVKNL